MEAILHRDVPWLRSGVRSLPEGIRARRMPLEGGDSLQFQRREILPGFVAAGGWSAAAGLPATGPKMGMRPLQFG